MIEQWEVTDALPQLLADATGKHVGLLTVPLVGGQPAPPPYYLIHPVTWTPHGAPVADLHEDATAVYQVTGVSGPVPGVPDSRGTVEQAGWLGDKARTAILGRDPVTRQWAHPLNLAGARCIGRRIDTEPGATNSADDATILYVIRFALDLATT